VTSAQVERERRAVRAAERHFDDLRISRPVTLRAVKAMDSVAGLGPASSDGLAARAVRVTAQSRQRALQAPAPAAEPVRADVDQRTHHVQQPGTGQTTRLP
jgi:hypothetical protein